LTTPGERIEERCFNGSQAVNLHPGTYLITTSADCTIEGSLRWSYSVGHVTGEVRHIEEKFLLKGILVNFTFPTYPTVPVMNWTHLAELQEFTYHKLPDLRRLTQPRLLSNSKLTWIVIAILIANVCIILGYGIWKYRNALGFRIPRFPSCRKQKAKVSMMNLVESNCNLSEKANGKTNYGMDDEVVCKIDVDAMQDAYKAPVRFSTGVQTEYANPGSQSE